MAPPCAELVAEQPANEDAAAGERDVRHTIHRHDRHQDWDNAYPPVLRLAPGDSLRLETEDAWGGLVTPATTAADLPAMLGTGIGNPTTGPVWVEGARPGDALKVTMLGFTPCGWGWTCVTEGFGLLADQFRDNDLMHWTYDGAWAWSRAGRVPVRPFPGTIGCAPAAPGRHSVVPPYWWGGNMDVRDICEGAELWLPVQVDGALFSLGDTHAAQGDGEVCGSAIETRIDVDVRIELVRGMTLATPRFATPGPVSRHVDGKGYEVTIGAGPDPMANARDALRRMIDLVAARHGLAPVDVYMLASCCADLRIVGNAGAVDPVVACYFPRLVLE